MAKDGKLDVGKALDRIRAPETALVSKAELRAGKSSELNAEIKRMRAQRMKLGATPPKPD